MHPSVESTLRSLQEEAPNAPLLALGQTVFWDEPLKAALPILAEEAGVSVKLVAGVHDTDYFAKLPGGVDARKPFVTLSKNDGSTKEFWSAAGEFSALFGSETPVTKEALSEAGVFLERIFPGDHDAVDKVTEAWGWRGLASSDPKPRVTAEIPMNQAFGAIQETFDWATSETLACLSEPEQREEGEAAVDSLKALLCDAREHCASTTLSSYYACLLPRLHQFVTGQPSTAEIVTTTKLLSFGRATSHLPRFGFVNLFLDPKTADAARRAYDDAVRGTEVYTLDKFGTGAIPFDLVIPKEGRGTIRLTSKVLIVTTPEPKFVTLSRSLQSVADLAAVVEDAFGECTLVGKAISFISMLAAEYVFAFHEGASMYVSQTKRVHDSLRSQGIEVRANPILRVGLEAWESLVDTSLWFRLPEPLRSPFGAEVVSGATLGKAWKCVREQQRAAIAKLGEARNIASLIRTLHSIKAGRWETIATEYDAVGQVLSPLDAVIKGIRGQVRAAQDRLRAIKGEWLDAERGRGEAFRKGDEGVRAALGDRIVDLRAERRELRERLKSLRDQQAEAAASPELQAARARRKEIAREAQLSRLRCVQEAVMATSGMEKTNRRPAAWWFAVASPDGSWFRNLLPRIQLRLEPL